MKIAVSFENGMVFQHFGKTEEFKVYEVEDGKVVACEVVGSEGQGHGALAGLLDEHKIDLVICGGIGNGAQTALAECGIEVCSGVEGYADEAVAEYLNGELESAGVNCDHHGEEEAAGCGGNCTSGCGGCGGGCGGASFTPDFDGINVGKQVSVHYRGTLNDGTQFDSSYDRGEPLVFVCGGGMMIRGFDLAVANMKVGEVVDVHLMPEEAYGPVNPEAIIKVDLANLPGAEKLGIGEQVYLSNSFGQQFLVRVAAKDEKEITFDANHEMAGKELNFRIELVEVM